MSAWETQHISPSGLMSFRSARYCWFNDIILNHTPMNTRGPQKAKAGENVTTSITQLSKIGGFPEYLTSKACRQVLPWNRSRQLHLEWGRCSAGWMSGVSSLPVGT